MNHNSQLWQYIIVFIILIGAVAWILYRLFSKKKKGQSCCGCSLADSCSSKKDIQKNVKAATPCPNDPYSGKDCCCHKRPE